MSTPPVEQVGGNHYAASYQHWDYCDESMTPYLEGTATKYLGRWEGKNGIEDLKKAVSYIDKRLASKSLNAGIRNHLASFELFGDERRKWYDAANVKKWERAVCDLVLGWRKREDLEYAKVLILAQIKHEETKKGIKHD